MSPKLGEPIPACDDRRAEIDGLKDFEQLLRFSAGEIDKLQLTYGVEDSQRHGVFINYLNTLLGIDLEELDPDEATGDYHVRVIDLGGLSLSETAVLTDRVVTEINYEPWVPESEEPSLAPGPSAAV